MVKRILALLIALLGLYKTFGPFQSYWSLMTAGGANDFASFYCAPRLIAGHKLYDSAATRAEQTSINPDVLKTGGPFPYIRLPYYAGVFWPLSLLPFQLAYLCWQVSAAAAILGFIYLWPVKKLPAFVLCCWFAPVRDNFVNGQDVAFLLLYAAASVYLARKRFDFAAGLVLSLCLSKFHLMLFVPVLLIASRRWQAAWGFAAGAAALVLASFAAGGGRWPVDWYRAAVNPTVHQNMGNSTVSFLAHHLGGPAFAASVLILFLAATAAVIYASRFDYAIGLAVALPMGSLVAFHVYSYDYLLLLPAFGMVVSAICGASTADRTASLLTAGVVLIAAAFIASHAAAYDIALLVPAAALALARSAAPRGARQTATMWMAQK